MAPICMKQFYLIFHCGNLGINICVSMAEDKAEYLAALTWADKLVSYDELYEMMLKIILKSHVSLTSSSAGN